MSVIKADQLEINKELVLSTSHVTEQECNSSSLENYSADNENIRLHVNTAKNYLCVNICPNLSNLVKLADQMECKWLVLDSAGFVVDGLKTFEW